MKTQVRVLKIEPDICAEEGSVRVLLLDYGLELWCYYQGSDEVVKNELQPGMEREVSLTLGYGKSKPTDKRAKTLILSQRHSDGATYKVCGVYIGKEKQNDEDFFVIDSIIPVYTDNELGNYAPPGEIGDWVETSGVFHLDYMLE